MERHLYQQEIEALRTRLADEGKQLQIRSASAEDIQWLKAQGVPESVIAFFAVAEPARWINIEGIEIGPVSSLKSANTEAVPGIAASRHGYVVVAQTVSGDAYCVGIHYVDSDGQPPVYIVNHERVWENASRQEVEAGSRLITPTFREFLNRFIAGDLPYDFYDQTDQ